MSRMYWHNGITIQGHVEAVSEHGVRIGETWFNAPKKRREGLDLREKIRRGAEAKVEFSKARAEDGRVIRLLKTLKVITRPQRVRKPEEVEVGR